MNDEIVIAAFESGRVPEGGFHHAQHVQAAYYYVRRFPLGEALSRFSTALQRFAAAQGKPELFHEPITTAFVLIIRERAEDPPLEWPAFAAAHPELLQWQPSILDRYYRPETLASDRARRRFVMPGESRNDAGCERGSVPAQERHPRSDDAEGDQHRQREWSRDLLVHPQELDGEADQTRKHQVSSQHGTITDP